MVKKILLALMVGTLLLSGCGSAPHPRQDVTIGLTYVPNIQFAPYYVALDQGYFEDAGIAVTLRHHGQDEDLFGALTQGTEDVVVAGGAEMIQAHEQGIDAITFQTLYATYPVAVIVPEESQIHTLADLAGKRLGVPGRFGETWFGALAFLEQAGLTESEVEIKEIGFTQQAALAGGHVDAVVGFGNNDVPQFRATGLPVRAVENDPIPVVGVGIGTTSEMLAKAPATLEAIASATARAVEDIIAEPQVALDAARNHIPGTITDDQAAVMLDVIERTATLYGEISEGWGVPDLAVWEEMNHFMAQMGLISAPVELSEVVTDSITGSE